MSRSSIVSPRIAIWLVFFFTVGPLFPATLPAADDPPEGFSSLFNGKDLTGWHGMNAIDPRKWQSMTDQERAAKLSAAGENLEEHWTVEEGQLVNDGKGVYLTTDHEYGDIELRLQYKTVPEADSGIYLRGTPQVQIWDYTEEGGKWNLGADKGSGGLWNNRAGSPGKDPLVLADRPFGQWNEFRIVQIGARTTVWLNGQLVVDHAIMDNTWNPSLPLCRRGPIQLQTHGGEIRWRNLWVREIPADEANRWLAEKNADRFQPIFNGRDFTGWAGPVDNYQIEESILMCEPHQGGTIYTEAEYSDFVARLEFQLPPGGNNGLAIRYPGHGDTAYLGMCELQIIDNGHPKYSQLDPRQFHGSAYGMVAAHEGYLRPVGQWNFQEVTVRGSTIKVELNGTVILDTDLSEVSQFMGGHSHPGKDRTRGHFGLAGHSDPVKFRNLSIRHLAD
jgi:hypothetical protein